MARKKMLTRTLAVSKAKLTIVDKEKQEIIRGYEAKLYGEYANPAALIEAVRESWAETRPNLIPLEAETVESYKATYEISLDEFLAHATERKGETESGEQEG